MSLLQLLQWYSKSGIDGFSCSVANHFSGVGQFCRLGRYSSLMCVKRLSEGECDMRPNGKQESQAESQKNIDSPLAKISACVISGAQIREVDRIAVDEFGMHSLVLMENAALGCVYWLVDRFVCPRTTILCGAGNNGGDGLAIARHLRVLGWNCTVVLCGDRDRLSADAASNQSILCHDDEECDLREINAVDDIDSSGIQAALASSELILDCLLGTGAKGAPRSPMDSLIRLANDSSAHRIAIDVPTGVDAETGGISGEAFLPTATLTFVARKPAMVNRSEQFGEVCVLPIGIPTALVKRVLGGQT